MGPIRKHIVTDETGQPIAVQVDYEAWQEIERELSLVDRAEAEGIDLSRFSGILTFQEDPVDYQHRMRREWA